VKLREAAGPPAGSARPASGFTPVRGALELVRQTLVITELEVRKLRHDFTEVITRGVQPVLWLLLFGQVFSHARAIPTGGVPYLDFMAPGILAQSVLFVSIFYGISVIWERDLGLINKFLVSPTPRSALVLGKALSAGVRSLPQIVVIFGLAAVLGVEVRWNPLTLLGLILAAVLGAALFSTFSLIVACLVKTRERFMGIGQVMTMPLFFASNAIYPLSMMPFWLQWLSRINPLTYEVDALRTLMIAGAPSHFGLALDFGVLSAWCVVLVVAGARLYPRVVT
jgi:ABC-2 type transport system permease protein